MRVVCLQPRALMLGLHQLAPVEEGGRKVYDGKLMWRIKNSRVNGRTHGPGNRGAGKVGQVKKEAETRVRLIWSVSRHQD